MGLHQATSGSIYMNGRQIDPYVDRKVVHPGDANGIPKPYASLNPRHTVNAIFRRDLWSWIQSIQLVIVLFV